MSQRIIPVVYATDENYLFYTCVSITSLAKNAQSDTFYRIYILVSDDFKDNNSLLNKVKEKFSNIEVNTLKISKDIFTKAHINNAHISKAAFYRLNVCGCVHEKKCIYLDSDTIITEDLGALYDFDLGANYFAACKDVWIETLNKEELENRRIRTRISDFHNYINSGVILFDLERMRENSIDKLLLKHMEYDYPYEDQDILNVVCYGRILLLPTKWNNFTAAVGRDVELREAGIKECEIQAFQKEEGIYHYITGEARPWNELLYWRNWCWWEFANIWKEEKVYHIIKERAELRVSRMNWKKCLDKSKAYSEVVIWGYTELAKNISDWLFSADSLRRIYFCDSNVEKQGNLYKYIEVLSPENILREHKGAFFIIVSARFYNDILEILENNGISNSSCYVYCHGKPVDYYRMLDKRYYMWELGEIYLKEGLIVPEKLMISELQKHPEWKNKYYLDRWILKEDI